MDDSPRQTYADDFRPRLRPVQAFPDGDDPEARVVVSDPTQLAEASLSMSIPALQLLALMDGTRSLADIEGAFRAATAQALRPGLLQDLVHHLDSAHFLDGPTFDRYYEDLQAAYRSTNRAMNDLRGLGLPSTDVGAGLSALFDFGPDAAAGGPRRTADGAPANTGRIAGIIAPHLDYPRGRRCYELAYSALARQDPVERFVILGTNHFGRALSVVATAATFETPLGLTAVDVAFLETLERRCGRPMRRFELDHQREHSIELHVLLLQHLFGAGTFEIVPLLCPDPCGPTGTAPLDGDGVDLQVLARELGQALDEDATTTCVVAAADLSHIGAFFGEDPPLEEDFLSQTRSHDESVLAQVVAGQPHDFVHSIAARDNRTRICSAGCIFTLMSALPRARAQLLGYDQAVDQAAQCSVSCAAVAFEDPCR